ncbi:NHL repeat-containing protein [Gemmatimonadota bacterium]
MIASDFHRRLLPGLILALAISATAPATLGQQGVERRASLVQVKPDEPMTLVFPPFLHAWGMQRGGPVHLRVYMLGRTRFDDPQGLAVTVLDVWDDPADDSDNAEVTVYGLNSGRGEIIYNTSMWSLGLYGTEGRGVGQFLQPHGIDADPLGNLLVADTGNNRVAVLFNNGSVLSHRRYLSVAASGDGLIEPYDVTLTPDNGCWVSDTGNSRLLLFDLEGEVREVIETGAVLGNPGALALSHPDQRWSYFHEFALFAANREGSVLVKFDQDGNEVARATAGSAGVSSMRIAYMTTDFYGNVWVTDGENHVIHKFDRNLNHLATFGSKGNRDREFDSPRGIDIWRRLGQTFIAEEKGAQYYWLGSDASDVTAVQNGTSLKIAYSLTEHSYLTVRARYAGGGIEELYRRRIRRTGRREEEIILDQDRPLSWIEIVVEPTYSSYTYREKVFHLRFPGDG